VIYALSNSGNSVDPDKPLKSFIYCKPFQMWFFWQLWSSWQDIIWHSALHRLCVIAELLVRTSAIILALQYTGLVTFWFLYSKHNVNTGVKPILTWYPRRALAWSNESNNPLWLQGNFGGWTSPTAAPTDNSRATPRLTAPAVRAPTAP